MGLLLRISKVLKLYKYNWCTYKLYKKWIKLKKKDTLFIISKPPSSLQDPALLFAGEALSYHHYSTTHGAYETGIQAANIILQNEAKKNRPQNNMS